MPSSTTIDLVALAKGTFKRLAWAYASSRKGSEQEAVLERMLRDRVMAEAREPGPSDDQVVALIAEALDSATPRHRLERGEIRAWIDSLPRADAVPECTGLTARWCPRCGDCCCVGDDMDNPSCPLHAPGSKHAEAVDPSTAPR